MLLGYIYCLFTQDFEFGYELARLGIKLMEALALKEINCKVSFVFQQLGPNLPGATIGDIESLAGSS